MNKTFFMFVLMITASILVCCKQGLRPEEKAIQLAEESQALGGETTVGRTIETWLKAKGEDVRPIGWSVTKKDDQVYLVAYEYKIYSFRHGSGERGFFFEVDLSTEEVENITEELTRELGSLAPPLRDEETMSDQLLQKWIEKEKVLSGGDP